jgi:hypothetical protein
MLRIEGIETSAPSSSSELRISGEASRQHSSSASGSGNGPRERERSGEGDDYAPMLDEFEKRMATLRKVVKAGEDRRKKIASEEAGEENVPVQEAVTEDPSAPALNPV